MMTQTIKEQILAVRDTGETNMFDVNAVQYMARILSAKFRAIPTYTPAPLWAGNSIVKTIAH